jgi:hypothetical protein
MRTHKYFRTLLLAIITMAASIVTYGCDFDWVPESPGYYNNSVPYYWQWTSWYCVPASILMWHDKWNGSDPDVTQTTIWNWIAAAKPGETSAQAGGGMSYSAALAGAQHFISSAMKLDEYLPGENQQALADFDKGLKDYNPTIVIIANNSHAVVLKGTSWSTLDDPLQRPVILTVTVHDPWQGPDPFTGSPGGADVVISVGHFMNNTIANADCGGCVKALSYGNQKYSGTIALDDFNLAGGRYLGPTPASPTGRYMLDGNGACYWESNDSGDNQCAVPPPPPPPPPVDGRYKLIGGVCQWVSTDSGPNQCTPPPPPTGRYKMVSGTCQWVATDSGPDQCSPHPPPTGRFKIVGGVCQWVATDSGPNQCTP